MSTGRTVVKNFLSLSAAEVIIRVTGTILTIYIARALGVTAFGELAFATAFIGYFNIFSDFGLTTLGIREVAKDRDKTNFYGSNILLLQVILSLLLLAILGVVLTAVDLPSKVKLLAFIFGLAIIPGAFNFGYILQGYQEMGKLALTRIIPQLSNVILAIILVIIFQDIMVVPVVSLGAAILAATLTYYFLRGRLHLSLNVVTWNEIKVLIGQAWPFLIAAIAVQVYYNIDSVMLEFMKGSETVGYYSASYKIITLLTALISLLTGTIYPLLAASYHENREIFDKTLHYLFRVTGFISWPALVTGSLLASPIITLLYGNKFGPSVLPFTILILLIPFMFADGGLGITSLATGRQKWDMTAVSLGAIVNLVLNFLLIPSFGMIGAAWATVAAEGTVFLTYLAFYLTRTHDIPTTSLLANYIFRPAASAAVMGVVIVTLQNNFGNPIISFFGGGLIYLLSMLALSGINRADIDLARGMMESR